MELKGMAKITGINCEAWPAFCKDHGAEETPMVKLFPLNPMPAYKYTGDMKKEKLVKALSKMIPNFVTELTSEARDTLHSLSSTSEVSSVDLEASPSVQFP